MTDQAFAERDPLVDLLAQVRALGAATTGTAGEGPASTAERLRDCAIGPLARLLDQAPDCLVPGLMDTIKPRRIRDGSTTEVPGGASGASDQVDVGRAQGPRQSSERVRADR